MSNSSKQTSFATYLEMGDLEFAKRPNLMTEKCRRNAAFLALAEEAVSWQGNRRPKKNTDYVEETGTDCKIETVLLGELSSFSNGPEPSTGAIRKSRPVFSQNGDKLDQMSPSPRTATTASQTQIMVHDSSDLARDLFALSRKTNLMHIIVVWVVLEFCGLIKLVRNAFITDDNKDTLSRNDLTLSKILELRQTKFVEKLNALDSHDVRSAYGVDSFVKVLECMRTKSTNFNFTEKPEPSSDDVGTEMDNILEALSDILEENSNYEVYEAASEKATTHLRKLVDALPKLIPPELKILEGNILRDGSVARKETEVVEAVMQLTQSGETDGTNIIEKAKEEEKPQTVRLQMPDFYTLINSSYYRSKKPLPPPSRVPIIMKTLFGGIFIVCLVFAVLYGYTKFCTEKGSKLQKFFDM